MVQMAVKAVAGIRACNARRWRVGSMGHWADGIGILAKKAPNDLILVG